MLVGLMKDRRPRPGGMTSRERWRSRSHDNHMTTNSKSHDNHMTTSCMPHDIHTAASHSDVDLHQSCNDKA